MLRPLENEIPSQVRKADEGWPVRIGDNGIGFTFNRHPDARKHFSLVPSVIELVR
jgi:hypothetical protein